MRILPILTLFFVGTIVNLSLSNAQNLQLNLNYNQAVRIAKVPIECINQEYPNRLGQTLNDSTHLRSPSDLHPIFYGCFDWHSSVHGHWLLAKMLNKFPDSELAITITNIFNQRFTSSNVQKELDYFLMTGNKNYERTYGWAWYLKLVAELNQSNQKNKHRWITTLHPLTNRIVETYKEFLPKLVYPIRVGEHTNTAFGLSLALDYARTLNDTTFEKLIISRSKDFYFEDKNCPINWEPSGFDFISPCLQEAHLMSNVLSEKEFAHWLDNFLPQFVNKVDLSPGEVVDRTDGKLVHLDGLNFSRAWCLYRLADVKTNQSAELNGLGDLHVKASIDHVIGSHYMGSHWLASFLVYALETRLGSK